MGAEPEAVVEVRAVLFDMDGTLVDSTEVVELLWARFADRYGVDLVTAGVRARPADPRHHRPLPSARA